MSIEKGFLSEENTNISKDTKEEEGFVKKAGKYAAGVGLAASLFLGKPALGETADSKKQPEVPKKPTVNHTSNAKRPEFNEYLAQKENKTKYPEAVWNKMLFGNHEYKKINISEKETKEILSETDEILEKIDSQTINGGDFYNYKEEIIKDNNRPGFIKDVKWIMPGATNFSLQNWEESKVPEGFTATFDHNELQKLANCSVIGISQYELPAQEFKYEFPVQNKHQYFQVDLQLSKPTSNLSNDKQNVLKNIPEKEYNYLNSTASINFISLDNKLVIDSFRIGLKVFTARNYEYLP